MPDVGVLNLQIHDNSSTAAEGLGRLAAKLEAVKIAVSGMRLAPVVNGIKNINEALKTIDESAITKLNKITDALERLGKVTGDVGGIRISFGGRGQSAEEIANSMQAARAAISDANSDFEDFKATVQEVSTQDEELARSVNGVKQSVNQLDFSVFDPAKLPLDALGMKLDDNAKELYQWKSAIKESFESVQQLKSKDLIKSFEEAEAAMKATKDAGEFGKDIVTSTSEATDALKELKEIAAQKWDTNFQQWFDSLEQTIQKLNEKLNAEQSRKRPSERAIAELSATIDAYKRKLANLQDQQTRFTNGTYFAGEAIKKEFADVPTEELSGKIEEVKNRIETMREALGKSDGSDAESIEKYNAMLDAMSAELEKAQAKWKAFTDQDNGNENKQAVFQSIKDAAKSMGISVDEAKRRLQQTYETVYANQSGTTSFSSAEEAAGSLGISLEEVKRKCQESYDLLYGTGSTGTGSGDIFSHVEEGAEAARTLLDMLRDKVQILQDEIDTGKTANGTLLSDKAIVNNEIQVEKLKQQIEQLQERIRAGQSLNGADFVANLGDYSKIDLYKMKLDAMQQSLINDINANKLDTQAIIERSMRINDLTDKIREMEAGQEEASEGAETLGEKLKNMFPKLDALKERFKNLLKYRILRSVIKQISDGLQEGMENYYYYSKAIGGNFATSMDNAASSLLTMKNSIGAAVAPLISSLIPYLQTVVNLFVEAVNYVNQFFALLNGQGTWSRATAATTTAFDDIANSASGASDSVSDLLADWDELNIIQNESSGSGSGTSGTNMSDYLDMFEEVSEYDETIKEIVNFIQDHFEDILSVATAIGAAILGWKVSNAFGGLVGKLGLLAGEIASIYIGVKLTDLFGQQYAETGEPGWLIADALSGAVGAYFAGRIANKLFTGNSAGFIVGGFTLILEGAVNIKNAVNAMSQQHEGEAWMLDALGSLEVGIGAGLAAFGLGATGPVSLALGTAVTVAMFLFTIPIMMKVKREAEYRQMAIEAFSKTGKDGISTEEYIKALQTRVNELTEGSEVVVSIALPVVEHQENFLSTLLSIKSLNALLSSDYALSEEDAQAFKDAWDIVINEFAEIEKINFETIYAGLDDVISNGSEKIREEAIALRKEAVEIARVMGGARGAMEEEMNQLTSDIVGGTLSGTDLDQAIARYEELYKIIAETEESGIGELQQRLQEGAAFDFSSGENPIEEAVNFIKTVSEQEIAPALESAKEAYETEIQAIEDAYSELEVLKKAGYLTDEQYTQSKEGLDRIKKLYEDAYADRVEQINALTQDAYKTVLEQAVAGLSDIDTSDKEAVNAYVKNVMDPITKALEEAGYEIPSDVKALMEMVTNEVYSFEPPKDSAVDKNAVYEGFARLAETNGINEMAYPVRMSIAYEIDENGGQAVSINDEKASDIVNGLIQTFDYQMDDVFEQLNAAFGWSYEDIFSKINLGALDVEQLENLIETVANLKTLAQEKLSPSSLTYNEDYKGIEDEYTNYMNEIQSIIEGQKEKTIEAPEMEIQQPTRTEIVGEESEYDAVLEWDSEGFKEEIREDVSGMDPINVPLNADFGAESSTSPTATSGNWASASLEGIWNSAMANAASAFNQAFGENSMFGTITINTERNDEQDTNNIAEGTKRGNVGLEAKLGQLNSTMSQLNGNVVNIATKIGGGLTNMGASTTGALINSALNAFNMVKG